jgi:hypothetical protein
MILPSLRELGADADCAETTSQVGEAERKLKLALKAAEEATKESAKKLKALEAEVARLKAEVGAPTLERAGEGKGKGARTGY